MLKTKFLIEEIQKYDPFVEYLESKYPDNITVCPKTWSYDLQRYFEKSDKFTVFNGSCLTFKRLLDYRFFDKKDGLPDYVIFGKSIKNLWYNHLFDAYNTRGFDFMLNRFHKTKLYLVSKQYKMVYPHARKLFLKPEKGLKAFAGAVVSVELLDEFIESTGCDDLLPVIFAPVVDIQQEWRLIYIDGKFVAASEYMRDGQLFMRSGCPQEVIDTANKASHLFDIPVVIDVCKTVSGDFKIVEFNCFNTAGFYLCDPEKIVFSLDKWLKEKNG